jgi:hypothetical protein
MTVVISNTYNLFLISRFRHVVNVVFHLLSDSPASEFSLPTFQNTLSAPSSWVVSSCLNDP